jgi:hypothetical protein
MSAHWQARESAVPTPQPAKQVSCISHSYDPNALNRSRAGPLAASDRLIPRNRSLEIALIGGATNEKIKLAARKGAERNAR